MIYIRKGVFETNSSSSHSIVLTKKDKPVGNNKEKIDGDWHVNKDGIMEFWCEYDLEFGRSPFALLTDWYDRLRYAIASSSREEIDDIEEICRRRIDKFVEFKFEKDRWGNAECTGYVDHQSIGLLKAALNKYDASLEDFIFNDKFIVVIDGDEYNVFSTFVETDMFNKDSVEDVTSACWEFEEGYWKDKEKSKESMTHD